MSLDREDILRLVKSIEEATAEAHVLWQALDEARTEIVNELRNIVSQKSPETSEREPESVACSFCDIDDPGSLSEALRQGWTRLQYDPQGLGHNFMGCCPTCTADVAKTETVPSAEPKNGRLFD